MICRRTVFEDRTAVIPLEGRTAVVPFESRTAVVPAESRTAQVLFRNRTASVKGVRRGRDVGARVPGCVPATRI